MAGRRVPAAILAAAVLAAGMTALATAPALAAQAPASPGTAAGTPAPAAPPGVTGPADLTQGGPQLASPGVVVNYPPRGVPWLPKLKASAFVVANAATGQVLAAKDAHGWFRPASTLKVLTAITLIPLLNPDATTVASRQAAGTQPNDAGLVAGRSYKISSLFQALLTISANDAAVALTQATGSFGRGMALINEEARALQAYDTVAVQPNGLDAPGQHTSAYDEALIARQALASPAFLGYDRTLSARFEVKPRHWETLVNQNQMLTDYPGDIGGKLGWTSAAGATYMGMAQRNGVTLIVTLLHCPPLTEFSYAAHLLNWGFAANGKVRPVGTLVSPLRPATAASQAARGAREGTKGVARDVGQDAAATHGATRRGTARHRAAPAAASDASAASGVPPAGPVAVAMGFLLLAALIVTGFAVHHRRAMARSRPGRPDRSAPTGRLPSGAAAGRTAR